MYLYVLVAFLILSLNTKAATINVTPSDYVTALESELIGAASGTEGFYLNEIYVYADKKIVNDTEPPVLISFVPANGSSNALAKGSIILTFDKKVKAST